MSLLFSEGGFLLLINLLDTSSTPVQIEQKYLIVIH